MDITRLIRPEVASLEAYVPILPFEVLSARLGRAPEAIIKLDANENPYGPSPRVQAALGAFQDRLRREFGVRVVDAREWLPDEAFVDSHHVVRPWAKPYTERLATEAVVPQLR